MKMILKLVSRSILISALLFIFVSVTPEINQAQAPQPTIPSALTKTTKSILGVIEEKNEPEVLGTITLIGPSLNVEPVDSNGSIVIPSINVNSPIAFDISVSQKDEYNQALENGVAHAKGTGKPNQEESNTYLFAHSTANEANIARYAAVFTKLNQLEIGERVTIFYLGKRYDYIIIEEEIVPSFDTTVLTRQHNFSALTLQTCHPPGIAKDRFITTAKLVGIYDK